MPLQASRLGLCAFWLTKVVELGWVDSLSHTRSDAGLTKPTEALAETALVHQEVTGDFLWHLQEV
jgi:hypothetical protein